MTADELGRDAGRVEIEVLDNTGDHRGDSFSSARSPAEFLKAGLADLHVMTVHPNCARGKHFHADKHEILVIKHSDRWTFEWDSGEGTAREQRTFDGDGAVLIRVPPGCWHDLRNDGAADLTLIGLSDRAFDPAQPDIHPRENEALAGS